MQTTFITIACEAGAARHPLLLLLQMKEFLETGKVEGLNQDGTTAAGGGAGGSGGAGAGGGPKVARPGDDVALKFM